MFIENIEITISLLSLGLLEKYGTSYYITLLFCSVFGVAIEVTVQRQESSRPIPFILMKCADYLILTGKNIPN